MEKDFEDEIEKMYQKTSKSEPAQPIQKASEKKEEQYYIPKNNMISILINLVAVLMLAGGVAGALYYESFLYFISTFVGAIFIFAVAEVINLQQKTLYMINKVYTKK